MSNIHNFDEISKQEPTPLINESIDEIYEALYQNGLEHILTDGTDDQKEIMSIHILDILSKDFSLLLGLMIELG